MLTIYDKILLRIEMINLKKNILFIVPSLILMIVLTLYLNNDVENTIYESKTTKLSTSDTLAMMYETEAGSGEYQIANANTWAQEGYVFNAELSKCENGSTLYWDDETKSVMMEANLSDKCYVYFDVKPSYQFETSGVSDFKSVKLNGEEITIGNSYEYEPGDTLVVLMNDTAAADSVLRVYNSENSLLHEYESFACAGSFTVELTGNETRMEFIKGTDYNRPSCP